MWIILRPNNNTDMSVQVIFDQYTFYIQVSLWLGLNPAPECFGFKNTHYCRETINKGL